MLFTILKWAAIGYGSLEFVVVILISWRLYVVSRHETEVRTYHAAYCRSSQS